MATRPAVTALRTAVYFRAYQHAQPILVLSAWAAALFGAWLVVMRRKEARPAPALRAAAGAS